MTFDMSTAKPVSGGFDISTAKAVNEKKPEKEKTFLQKASDFAKKVSPSHMAGAVAVDALDLKKFGKDAVDTAGVDITKGLLHGNQAFLKPASSVMDFIGVPDEKNMAKQLIADNQVFIDNLPKSKSPTFPRVVNEMIGSSPGVIGEFQQGALVMKGAGLTNMLSKSLMGQKLTTAGEFAVTGAIEALPDGVRNIAKSAADNATLGLLFPGVGGAILGAWKGAKSLTRKMISAAGNNTELARDVVDHPWKYAKRYINKKVNTVKQAKAVDKEIKEGMKQAHKDSLNELKDAQALETSVKNEASIQAKSKLQARSAEVKASVKEGGTAKVAETQANSNKALAEHEKAFSDNMDATFNEVLNTHEHQRIQAGELLDDALHAVTSKSPLDGIPRKRVISDFRGALKKGQSEGLFDLPKRGGVKPITTGQQGISKEVNTIMSDINNSLNAKGEVPLKTLNGLHRDAKSIAERAFSNGDTAKGTLFSRISDALNPSKMASRNPNVSAATKELSNARGAYETVIKPFKELKAMFTKTNANGEAVLDGTGVISAIRRGDRATIKRMKAIDDQIVKNGGEALLPRVQRGVDSANKFRAEQVAHLNAVKKANSAKLKQVTSERSEIEATFERQARAGKYELSQSQKLATRARKLEQQQELKAYNDSIEAQLKELEDIDTMNSFLGKGFTAIIQRAAIFTALPSFIGGAVFGSKEGTEMAFTSLVPGVLLSPRAGLATAKAIKGAEKIAEPGIKVLEEASSKSVDKAVAQLIASRSNQ